MKKLLTVMLALAMLVSMTGAAFADGEFVPAESYDIGERVFDGGKLILEAAGAGSGSTVSTDVYAGIEGKDYTDEKVYTFHDSTGALTTSMNWDVLSWETSSDDDIRSMIVTPFYNFVLNSDKTGYSIVPELAADYPVDVTAEYVGQYGVKEGEEAKAWRIALRQDICFDDGVTVNADDFIYSMQQQLNPKILNRRADSWYDGSFSIVNAKNYLYAGASANTPVKSAAQAAELLEGGTDVYVDMWGFWGLEEGYDAEGNPCPQYVSVTSEELYRDPGVEEGADGDWITAKEIYEGYLADGAAYASYAPDYLIIIETTEVVSWDDVGFKKVDDYTIDFILEKPVAEAAFYVPYYLSDFLVEKDVYEANKTFYANGVEVATEEEADEVKSNYCRSLETSVSYGPYKLASFQLDKEYSLTRNENWFGYKDGKHLGQYQMDNLVVTVIVNHATEIEAFEKGELDVVGLQSEDMDKYAASAYIHYTPQSYTTKLTFNTDYEKLLSHGTGSQILVVDEFRKGLSFALDANDFATAYTAAGTAGYGILNYQYCYNPFTGELYRDSEYAKAALVNLFEMEYGEGTDYPTLDDAYEAMTGYDMEKANALMAVAADKAIAANIWDGESEITLEFRVYNSDEIYVKMFNYFNQQLADAVKGTKLEGKVRITLTVDADYYDSMYAGVAEIIFSTWGGSSMDPFGMLGSVYTDMYRPGVNEPNQMEYGYDTSKIILNFDCGDLGIVSDTLQHWTMWANNCKAEEVPAISSVLGDFADYSYETRCQAFAAMEQCYMNWYPVTSLYYRNVASLTGQKVNYASDTYLTLIGFGGSQFYTFNYDDAEWADYIANNTLQY